MQKGLLKNQVILVTGASKGLGREIAKEIALQGGLVVFTYSKDVAAATETLSQLREISDLNHQGFAVSCASMQANLDLAKIMRDQYSRLDGLVNNAGVSEYYPFALLDENDWDKIFEVNLKGVFITTKAFAPLMVKQRKGVILNISSLAGVRILAAPVHYCSAKAGIKGFTESLSKELGRYNIRVNCLAPGILSGGVAQSIPKAKLESYISQLSLKRIGEFSEVAKICSFMLSDLSSYMSGATVVAEGGL